MRGGSCYVRGAAAAIVATGIVQCGATPESCSGDDCDKLNQAVQEAKRKVGKLGACTPGMKGYQLRVRRRAWLQLAIARARRDSKCWNGGDDGHQQAHAAAWQHVYNCDALI